MIEGLGKHLIWGYQGVEGPGAEGNGGKEIEVHTKVCRLEGLKGEAREEGECEADQKRGLHFLQMRKEKPKSPRPRV